MSYTVLGGRVSKTSSEPEAPMSNPYDNFIAHLNDSEHPNFLQYLLHLQEKHAYSDQARVLKALREKLEETYELAPIDPWKKDE